MSGRGPLRGEGVLGLAIVIAIATALVVSRCWPDPSPVTPSPAEQAAVRLAQRNAVLEQRMVATAALSRRDSVRLDSLQTVARRRQAAATAFAQRADSATEAAQAVGRTQAEQAVAYEGALALKDTALQEMTLAVETLTVAVVVARADIRRLTRGLDTLRTQNAALVHNADVLRGEVDTWRKRAARRWYLCGGAGGVAGAGTGSVYAGPGLFGGVCRVLPWP